MIIGVNGKIGSGKDTVGKIIQYLTSECGNSNSSRHRTYAEFLKRGGGSNLRNFDQHYVSDWEVKKFAGKLKTTASLLTGIPVENFEDQEFKKALLGEEWGTVRHNPLNNIEPFEKFHFNELMSVREFLQKLGTEAMREGLHTNVWVNALFADYKPDYVKGLVTTFNDKIPEEYPNWIITDMRFPNEMEAVKNRSGITIRVERHSTTFYKYSDEEVIKKLKMIGYKDTSTGVWEELAINEGFTYSETLNKWSLDEEIIQEHESETASDEANFDYVIDNNGTIEDLIEKVKEILIKENII
jgi:hypothetical protein